MALVLGSALALIGFAWWPPAWSLGLISGGLVKTVWFWLLVWLTVAGLCWRWSPAAAILIGWSAVRLATQGFLGWGHWTLLSLAGGLGLGVVLLATLPPHRWRLLRVVLTVVALVTAAHLLWQVAAQREWPFPGWPGRRGASGLWGNPWMVGTFLAMLLPLVVGLHGLVPKLAGAGVLLAIILTGSRLAWAAAGGALLTMVWLEHGLPRRAKLAVTLAALLAVVGAVTWLKPITPAGDIARLHVWATMGAYLDPGHVLVGYGLGRFAPWFSQLRHNPEHPERWTAFGFNAFSEKDLDTPQEIWFHAHSDWLQLLFELGVFGIIALAVLLAQLLGWLREARCHPIAREAHACAAGLVAFGIAASGAFPAHVEGLAMTAVLLAVGLSCLARWPEWSI